MNISKRLTYLRKQCGLSQNGLAERAGVSQSHLRRVELEQADITIGHLQLLCDAMSISIQEFFKEEFCTITKISEDLTPLFNNSAYFFTKKSVLFDAILPSINKSILLIVYILA